MIPLYPKLKVLTLLCSTVLIITACDSNSSSRVTNNEQERVVIPTATPSVNLRVVNEEGEAVPNTAITISDFEDNVNIQLNDEGVVEETTNDKGKILLELPELPESVLSQAKLKATIKSSEDYFGGSLVFSLEGETTSTIFTVKPKPKVDTVTLDPETQEPIITTAVNKSLDEVKTTTFSDGKAVTGRTIEIKTEKEITGEAAPVEVPVATVVVPNDVVTTYIDENGEEQAAGESLSVDAAIYETTESEVLESFPGGLAILGDVENADAAANVRTTSEESSGALNDSASFITAGYVSLEVTDENNNTITQFNGDSGVDLDGDGTNEQGLIISTLVPKSMINPETGEAVQVGDEIPLWSYNEEKGQWKFEGQAYLFEEANEDYLNARFAATHLTSWNLDYFQDSCSIARIEFEEEMLPNTLTNRRLDVSLKRFGSHRRGRVGDGFLRLWNVPSVNMIVEVREPQTGELLPVIAINGQSINANIFTDSDNGRPARGYNFCLRGGVNRLTLDTSKLLAASLKKVNFKLQTSCQDASLNDHYQLPKPMPSTWADLYKSGNLVSEATTNNEGIVSYEVLDGIEYSLDYYNNITNSWGFKRFTVSELNSDPYVIDYKQDCPQPVVTTGSSGG